MVCWRNCGPPSAVRAFSTTLCSLRRCAGLRRPGLPEVLVGLCEAVVSYGHVHANGMSPTLRMACRWASRTLRIDSTVLHLASEFCELVAPYMK